MTPITELETYRLLMENVRDYAIFTMDVNGCITRWNVGAERILGYSEAEAAGMSSYRIFLPEEISAGEPAAEMARAAADGRTEDERWHVRKDGSRFWAVGILTALKDENGSLRGYAKILRDFTERQQNMGEIQALNRRLRRAMAESHHRIKNNLQVIAALVDLQVMADAETVPMSEIRRLAQHIRSLAVVHDLLTRQVQTEAGAEFVSAKDVLEKLLPMVQTIVDGRHLEHTVEDVRLPVRYSTSLAILVNELVSNAVKHGQGLISLSLRSSDGSARLEVHDDGPGFPPGFDPLKGANTGLQLVESVSRWDLQGTTAYYNPPEGGAIVAVEFPTEFGETSEEASH